MRICIVRQRVKGGKYRKTGERGCGKEAREQERGKSTRRGRSRNGRGERDEEEKERGGRNGGMRSR